MRRLPAACVGLSVCLLAAQAVHGEVSIDVPENGSVNIVILGIIDDADPIPGLFWQPFRPIPPERMLNPEGFAQGDGRPDIQRDPLTGFPVVAWSRMLGPDYEIAVAEWTGDQWSAPDLLTFETDDDLDPRIAVDPDGTLHLVWWKAGTQDSVWLISRDPATGNWAMAERVTASNESGRRPSVVIADGTLIVAYERDSTHPVGSQEIVAARRIDGDFVTEVIAQTARTEELDVVIHAEAGRLWADWKHGVDQFARSVAEPLGWTELEVFPWLDFSWVGVEETRGVIRQEVLGP